MANKNTNPLFIRVYYVFKLKVIKALLIYIKKGLHKYQSTYTTPCYDLKFAT